jgi:Flp pilus assembly protein TadD
MAEAHRLAEENFQAAPNDPTIASTRAFSLHLQKRTREGIAILARLPESELQQPSLAAYYGVLLTADGDREKAKPFLEIASQKKQELLPEEAALVEAALKQP